MQVILFDNRNRNQLFPFTTVRAVADLRIGLYSLKERWELYLQEEAEVLTENYIQPLYGDFPVGDLILIDASVLPTKELSTAILNLEVGSYISYNKGFIAGRVVTQESLNLDTLFQEGFAVLKEWNSEVQRLDYPWQLFQLNSTVIKQDFDAFLKNKTSQALHFSNTVFNQTQLFVEEGASVLGSMIDATDGPVYIGKDATLMPGSFIKGPCAIGANSVVKMGAKIYGTTSVGNNCLVGGEVKNSIIFNNSNKAHDGYMGDSVIGEWCNWGAGTTNSNVKNNAGIITIINSATKTSHEVGNKCGVLMGHYTKMAINSSINTGSLFGVGNNVFGSGLLPKQLHSFCWGTNEDYDLDKCLTDIDNWMQFKNSTLSEIEKQVIINFKNQL